MSGPLLTVLLMLATVVGLALLMYFIPNWTRPDLFFATTVEPSFRGTPEAARTLRQYRLEVWVHAAIAIALVFVGAEGGLFGLLAVAPIYMAVAMVVALVRARRRVRPYSRTPSELREASLSRRRAHLPGGWLGQAGPFAILAGTAVVLARLWGEVPARFPVHWGVDLQPDRWAVRSVGAVFMPLLTGAFLAGLLLVIAFGTLRWSRRIDASGVAAERERRFRTIVVGVVLAVSYAIALLSAWSALMPLRSSGALPADYFFLIAIVFAVTALGITLLARVRREAVHTPAAAAPVGDRTPDSCWKLGVFYFNRDDPALFVEKRFGLGYTLNFGKVWAWVLLALVVAMPLVFAVVFGSPR